jgi:tRNA A-37 threonylcarbamoyl transferase component Bud32
MNNQENKCAKCGIEVPAEAPQGLCPKCVMAGTLETATGAPSGAGSFPPEAPPIERIAAAFPQLEIAELIGAGGMGAVYKARQPKLERWVALKILPEKLAADPAFTERFTREARLLGRLNHPNIVAVYDFGQSGGFFFLLMEYVDGINLREAMATGRFSPVQALAIVPRICEALQYAHDEGILHRDIKPANILLDAKGRVKIADFGIAKLAGAVEDVALTASGAAVGTPHYMAPEQLEHPREVDQRADIYSLGVVFYEMLTGELPIGRFAPPSEKATVDPRVDPIVLQSLERDREKRFRSANEVKTRVENLSSSPPPPVETPPAMSFASAPGFDGKAKWSGKAMVAAVCSSLTLILGLLVVLVGIFIARAVAHRMGGIGAGELVIVLGIIFIAAAFGFAGVLLGVMARREIRDSGGALRGAGLAAFAVWVLPALASMSILLALLAVGWSNLRERTVSRIHTANADLVMNQTSESGEGNRRVEVVWAVSIAPRRSVMLSVGIYSNGVPVLKTPQTRAFVTPDFAGGVDGFIRGKVMPGEQPPWRVESEVRGVAPQRMTCDSLVPAEVEWQAVAPLRMKEFVLGQPDSFPLFSGVQKIGAGPEAHTAAWEAVLTVEVSEPPGEAPPILEAPSGHLPVPLETR